MHTIFFDVKSISIIFGADLEITLRMRADRAYLRSFFPYDDVSAVSAFPDFYLALFEYRGCLYIFEKRAESFFVLFFYISFPLHEGDVLEAEFSENKEFISAKFLHEETEKRREKYKAMMERLRRKK